MIPTSNNLTGQVRYEALFTGIIMHHIKQYLIFFCTACLFFTRAIEPAQALTWLDLLEQSLSPSPVSLQRFNLHRGIEQAARKYHVKEEWIAAILLIESAANPCAVSHAGAAGLMQLMPQTARNMGVWDRFNPQSNLSGGARYLALALKQTHGDIRRAAAMYNAGPKVLNKPLKQWFPETRRYVTRYLTRKLNQFKQKPWRKYVPKYIPWTNLSYCQG